MKKKIGLTVLAIVIVAAVITFCSSLYMTGENEYTLVRQFGRVNRVTDTAGLHFKMPFIEDTVALPKNIQLYDLAASDVITRDKKTMIADSYALWRITDPLTFAQSLNLSITNAQARINTTVYNSMKTVISSLDQTEVINGRDGELSAMIMDNIGNKMEQYGVQLISVETKRLDLPEDNKNAVYERMISERAQMAASFTAQGEADAQVIRNETDKQVSISISDAEAQAAAIRAEGESEFMKIMAAAYNSPERQEFYEFTRALDMAKNSLSDENKVLIVPSDSPLSQLFLGGSSGNN